MIKLKELIINRHLCKCVKVGIQGCSLQQNVRNVRNNCLSLRD